MSSTGRGPKEQRQPRERRPTRAEWRGAGQRGGPGWRLEPGLQYGRESGGSPGRCLGWGVTWSDVSFRKISLTDTVKA